ncbi:MAG TPA: hypothetical protein VFD03_06435 [Clostridia bacterium]|nr:hypothetical protein [Clostridia bacterium]
MSGKKAKIALGLFLIILLLSVGLFYWLQHSNTNSKPNYGTPFLDPQSNLAISGAIGHFPRFGTADQYIMFIKMTNYGEPLYYTGISVMLDSDSSSEGRRGEIHWLGWELNGSFEKALLPTGETIEDQFEISDAKSLLINSTNGKMLINITLKSDEKPLGSFYTVVPSIYENNENPAELKAGEQRHLQFVDEQSAMKEVYGSNSTKVENYYITRTNITNQ